MVPPMKNYMFIFVNLDIFYASILICCASYLIGTIITAI